MAKAILITRTEKSTWQSRRCWRQANGAARDIAAAAADRPKGSNLARRRQCGEPITFLSGHIGLRSTCPMSEMGQTEKNSVRAYVFRFSPRTRTLLNAVGNSHSCQ